jgi:hypothetical protein
MAICPPHAAMPRTLGPPAGSVNRIRGKKVSHRLHKLKLCFARGITGEIFANRTSEYRQGADDPPPATPGCCRKDQPPMPANSS